MDNLKEKVVAHVEKHRLDDLAFKRLQSLECSGSVQYDCEPDLMAEKNNRETPHHSKRDGKREEPRRRSQNSQIKPREPTYQ